MTSLTIDLQKNPDLAALVADKEPGDKITLNTSIKDLNEQTLTVTIESCEEGDDNEDNESNDEVTAEGENDKEPVAPEKPKKSYGKQYMETAGMSE